MRIEVIIRIAALQLASDYCIANKFSDHQIIVVAKRFEEFLKG